MQVGKMKYIVTTHFKENGRETAEHKLLNIVAERITDGMERSDKLLQLTN